MKTAGIVCVLAVVGRTASPTWAAVESFEGMSAGDNVGLVWSGYGYLIPGVDSAFTFASGVTLTAPIPNPGGDGGVLVCDWSIEDATFGLDTNGNINSASDVVSGTAFMGLNGGRLVEFTFASDVHSVGVFVTAAWNDITLTAFDSTGSILGATSVASVSVTDWDSNWLGFSSATGIRKVQFSGDYIVLDDLTFDSVASVPAPGAVVLGVFGTGLVGWLRRRRSM